MAVLETLKSFFVPAPNVVEEEIIPAPLTEYLIRPMTSADLKDILRLNLRCFTAGDSYNKHTLTYLLNEPQTLSYKAVTFDNDLIAFAFVMVNPNGAGHLTTIGVAPEHRRRGLGERLLMHIENMLRRKAVGTLMLEVRVSNFAAQQLYRGSGFHVVQRIANYYNNGEDCYLMIKSLA
jgi:[ribosomal protein S18]-alanine N-acetyltransferase